MDDLGRALLLAAQLVARRDPELRGIISLSLQVSLSAALAAFVFGAPAGAWLAVARFRGRGMLLIGTNALLGLLFTPAIMVAAQTLLALPIVVAVVHRAAEPAWTEVGDALRMDGAKTLRCVWSMLAMTRPSLLTALLAAFGRTIAEVGAIIMVGGNIRGVTRTMTTAIALETSRGNLALAWGLVLLAVTLGINMLTSAQ